MPASSDVSAGDTATAAQYNNLRAEVVTNRSDLDDLLARIFFPAYADGSDGALNVTSGTTTIDCENESIVIKQYTSFNVSVGATLAFSNVPAEGLLFIPIVQGNYTMAGTISLNGEGSAKGDAVVVSLTSGTQDSSAGDAATEPVNNAGQTRCGQAGLADSDLTDNDPKAAASGGGGSASAVNSGSASSTATAGIASAVGRAAGTAITAAIAYLASQFGITMAPGAGGPSGGAAAAVFGYTSGTFTATSGAGSDGGGSMLVFCGGDYSHTGTVNMSTSNASNGSVSTGSASKYALAAGGGAPGAPGCFAAFVRGTITNSGTYNVTAGSPGTSDEAAAGSGAVADSTSGAASGAGQAVVVRIA
jgi:hypothetical protein